MMKKTYKIEVDCANCAQKMEDAANTVAGVAQATVSFMTEDEGGVCRGCRPPRHHGERSGCLQKGRGRL